MMKQKKVRWVLLALLLSLLAICGTAVAYMFVRSESKDNQFTPAYVTCKVHEKTDENVTLKSSITVENTSNIDAYIRVRLVSYWVQDDGNGNMQIVGEPSVIPSVTPAAGWLEGQNNTYYYTSPVADGGFTGELLSAPLELTARDDGCLQVIEVFAEAIQSKPVNAVTSSWNVSVNADTGIITRVQ